jgi:serine/threonine protein kinase
MQLTPGTKLAEYEILASIGAGGMGEVYKARDTKLGREVAIKVLPEAFAENKERLARFEREARLLASLNHPNIATLFDLQESDGVHFLVLEFVPGETLAERIKRGPIPLDEALRGRPHPSGRLGGRLHQAIPEGPPRHRLRELRRDR